MIDSCELVNWHDRNHSGSCGLQALHIRSRDIRRFIRGRIPNLLSQNTCWTKNERKTKLFRSSNESRPMSMIKLTNNRSIIKFHLRSVKSRIKRQTGKRRAKQNGEHLPLRTTGEWRSASAPGWPEKSNGEHFRLLQNKNTRTPAEILFVLPTYQSSKRIPYFGASLLCFIIHVRNFCHCKSVLLIIHAPTVQDRFRVRSMKQCLFFIF